MTDAGLGTGGSAWFGPGVWAVLGALGLWTALDMTAFLQILVSQPLVAAWLGGWVAGEPGTGLAVGIVMQGTWGRSLPLGLNPLPMVGPAAVVAGTLAASAPGPRFPLGPVLAVPGAMPLAVALLLGIATASVGKLLVSRIQRGREDVLNAALAAAEEGRASGIMVANLRGMIPTATLGMIAVPAGVALGLLLFRLLGDTSGGHGGWVALPVLGVGIGQTASLAGGRRAWIWAAAALVLGILAVAVW